MQGPAVVFGLVAGVLVGLHAAPESTDAELQRCLRECGETSSGTDAQTCRLQCRQRAEHGEAPIKHWKRTELKGGSPDPNVEGGSTTTVTERGPDGTTTTVTKVDRAGKTTVTRHAGGDDASASFTIGTRLQAWCYLGCSTHDTFAQRTSCRTRCPRVSTVAPRASVRTEPSPKSDPATCRSACTSRAQRCHDACPAANADRATCKLQCDEGESSCKKRC